MPNLFLTLVVAFVIIVIAIACLAIGWLIIGRTRIQRGMCGKDQTKKMDESCGASCSINSSERNILHKGLDKDENMSH